MRLHGGDVWGHFAPLFHLVDVFAVYAITAVGGRHVILPTFNAQDVLLAIGERRRIASLRSFSSPWAWGQCALPSSPRPAGRMMCMLSLTCWS